MGKSKIISVQQHSKSVISPIIVGWENGSLKDEFIATAQCDVKTSSKNIPNFVEVKIGNAVYEGQCENNRMRQTFIAIRSKNKKNPNRSKLRLFEASSTLLGEKKMEQVTEEKVQNFELNDKFYKVFGSKKGLLQYQTKQKMNIVTGGDMRDGLKEQLQTVQTNQDEHRMDLGLLAVLPKCNRNAILREEVYNVESIIPEDIMIELEESAQDIINVLKESKKLSEEEYTAFFIEGVAACTKSSKIKIEEDVLKEKIKMLIFCELLLKLNNSKRHVGYKNFSLVKHLPITNQYILDSYLAQSPTGRQWTYQMEDKSICHVMILSLLACSYVLNIKALCSSVTYSTEKIAPMLNIVGVSPVPGTDKNMYVLKTPLPALTTLRRAAKRN